MTTQDNRPAHSPIGASTYDRWSNCPGSVALIATLPEGSNEGTFYSSEGTVAHMLVERAITARIKGEAYDLPDEVGRSYVEDGFEIEVKEEMVDAVELYLSVVQEYIDYYGLSWQHDVQVEVQFDLTHIDPEAFGTCDTCISVPMNREIIIDFKYGAGHAVEVENNGQLLYYGLGAYYRLPASDRADLGHLETVVVQPRARHIDGPVRRHTYDISFLREHEANVQLAVNAVRRADGRMLAGKHCKWCPAKPVCSVHREHVQGLASLDFTNIEKERIFVPEPAMLTPDGLAQLLRNANEIKSWCASILDYGHRVAETGTDIPGFKLVERKANRRWRDEAMVRSVYEAEFGDKLYTKKFCSPAGLEKLLKTKRKKEIEHLWEQPPAGKVLAPVEDAREVVFSDAQADFEAFIPA